MSVPYTRLPRPTLWLLRGEGELRAFYIARAPITNLEYEAFDPAHARGPTAPDDTDPVVNVSFTDALAYCRWYSEASGKDFRLPSDAEWTHACQGGGEAWDADRSQGRCHPVEGLPANELGLYDLLGNVWEWTADQIIRGGSFRTRRAEVTAAARLTLDPTTRRDDLGFRIVRFL